jgi:RES domain-containing protein
MLVWRICRARFAADPLSGEGARVFGGRWNPKGTRLVYTAGSQSLATLKVLGSAWVRAGKEPVLWVPSAIIDNEWDVLINPEHPLALKLKVRPPIPFAFDPRLFQGAPAERGPEVT